MPVIGINEVPREIVRPKWYEDMGYAQGRVANQLLMALMGQMGSGGGPMAQKNIPNPTYGQSQNPQVNPGVAFSVGQQPSMTAPAPQLPQGIMQRISTPAPTPGPFANQPMLNQQQFKALSDLQSFQAAQEKARQDAAMAPLERQAKQSSIGVNQSIADFNNRIAPPGASSGGLMGGPASSQITQLQGIADRADAGDPTAKAVMDYILSQQ